MTKHDTSDERNLNARRAKGHCADLCYLLQARGFVTFLCEFVRSLDAEAFDRDNGITNTNGDVGPKPYPHFFDYGNTAHQKGDARSQLGADVRTMLVLQLDLQSVYASVWPVALTHGVAVAGSTV
jgi:hypothetical protein